MRAAAGAARSLADNLPFGLDQFPSTTAARISVLAPALDKLDPETFGKLSRALTLLLGIDPVVVMKDIAGASKEEAIDALEWSARALVGAAVVGGTPALPPAKNRWRKGGLPQPYPRSA